MKKTGHKKYWLIGILLVLVLVISGTAFAITGFLRQFADSKGSSTLGRDFSIGTIKIDWAWTMPYVHLTDIKLSNLPQSQDPNMVSIDHVDFHIKIWKLLEGQLNLPDIDIVKPNIVLEKFDADTANWKFPAMSKANVAAGTVLPSKRSNFPILGTLAIHDGTFTYRDITKKLSLTLGIDTAQAGGGEKGDFVISGNGSLQERPFVIKAQGGSLGMLRESHVDYPLNLHLQMGDTVGDIAGTFADPVKMEGIDTKLDLKGKNLADLFYVTQIPLPPTPPYELTGHLVKKGGVWTFDPFAGKVGNSDLSGHLSYDMSGERGFMQAELNSKKLDMKDLAGFVGATPAPSAGEKLSDQQNTQLHKEQASPRLIPDVPVNLTRLRTTDLDVTFKADEILAPGLPVNNMDVRFNLKDGILRINPLSFGIAAGQLGGSLVLNGQQDVARADIDLSLTRLSLKKFFGDTSFAALTSGTFGGRFQLQGHGKSLSDILADSNGDVTVVMSGGTISQLIVDAAGLDIGRAAPVLIGSDKSTPIRCGVADFPVTDGILNSKIFVIDTGISNIGGDVHVNLKDETIHATIKAEPKEPSVTVHAGITVSGSLKHPAIGLDAQETAERGAAAAVLSVFLTPLAAVIPFIEIGVGKDSDCKGLISQVDMLEKSVPVTQPAATTP
jgi:uncharacterized protein involved in outer membrane biogenesis